MGFDFCSPAGFYLGTAIRFLSSKNTHALGKALFRPLSFMWCFGTGVLIRAAGFVSAVVVSIRVL